MGLYKSGRYALPVRLVLWVCCCLLCCCNVAITSSRVSVPVCIQDSYIRQRRRLSSSSVTGSSGGDHSCGWTKTLRTLYKRTAVDPLAVAPFEKLTSLIYTYILDPTSASTPPPFIMVGLAVLAVPLIMRAVSPLTGSGDMANAAPAASVDATDVAVKASPGCTIDHSVSIDTTLNVTLGDRRYLLYFPINYKPDKPAPLVLSYHGGTRTAETQQALDLLSTTYFNQDYIIVYPNGIGVGQLFSYS